MRLRRAIATIPSGEYTFEDFMDGDGRGAENIPIRLKITVEASEFLSISPARPAKFPAISTAP